MITACIGDGLRNSSGCGVAGPRPSSPYVPVGLRRGCTPRLAPGVFLRPWCQELLLILVIAACRGKFAVQRGGADGDDERIKVTVEDDVDVVPGFLDAVVGDAVLREVVRADLLRTFAGADLTEPQRLFGSAAFFLLDREEARAENAHGAFLVLRLRTFILTLHDHAGREVRD